MASSSSWTAPAIAVGMACLALLLRAADAASWCVARSHVSQQQLQTALDYACGAGADCTPIQTNGLCFLPNTLEAHASYAFNSFYQRKSMAPGSCDFAGAAAVASTDPSYGSCVYPSSASNAGGTVPAGTPLTGPGTNTPTTTTTTPTTSTPGDTPVMGGGIGGTGVGGFTPLGPTVPNTDTSMATNPSFDFIALSLIWVAPLLFPPI
ncbi:PLASMODESMATA CALLOSE-BINDING PROTEIN 3-like [Magnolia sinica]|uniref:PLASMODESMATA CALLOSE-BINDING PROTEIN 3-like n=1 Tax=Magnolia sinica TaxID=86752 RepID=UPI0026592D34|nr:PLASMODESMATA CALLOSE-BINDING PROTEIN 3-like [Magnolia sinica]